MINIFRRCEIGGFVTLHSAPGFTESLSLSITQVSQFLKEWKIGSHVFVYGKSLVP